MYSNNIVNVHGSHALRVVTLRIIYIDRKIK